MAVPVETEPAFAIGSPRRLFEAKSVRSLAVRRDGQRFVVVAPNPEGRVSQRINVVFNWFEELKRLAPIE